MCPINTYILIYRYARCDYMFWNDHSALKYRIFTKLSQIVYLTDEHILVCQYRAICLDAAETVGTLNTDSLKNKAKQITVKAFLNTLKQKQQLTIAHLQQIEVVKRRLFNKKRKTSVNINKRTL